MLTLYGIPNCDTVKKARTWLTDHQLPYEFHDFKKMGVAEDLLQGWLQHLPLEQLLNRKSTTWRKLSAEEQARALLPHDAMALMQAQPSLIKRPILAIPNKAALLVGFDSEQYRHLLVTSF